MISIFALFFACSEKSSEDTGDTSTTDTSEDTTADTSEDTGEDTGEDTDSDTTVVPNFVGMDFILESSEGYQPISENISLGFPSMDGDSIAFQFYAGCNSMGGTFTLDAGSMNVAELSATEMGCESELMDQDDWFVGFWSSNPMLSFSGDLLTVSDGANIFTFRDAEVVMPDLPLVDTRWVIDTFIDGGSAMAMNLDSDPWVEFRADGAISLNTGCNSGSGSYTVENNLIIPSMELYTEAQCPDSTSQEAERLMFSLFVNVMEYAIDANRIQLIGDNIEVSGLAQE